MAHYVPALIMLAFTIGLCALLWLPTQLWKPRNGTVRFYWTGMWVVLSGIASIAGGVNVVLLLGVPVSDSLEAILNTLPLLAAAFVVAGWFHLVGLGVIKGVFAAVRRMKLSAT